MADAPGFTLTGKEYADLVAAVERDDAPAHAYVRDLERLGRAYLAALADPVSADTPMPGSVRRDLEAFVAALGAVVEPLYRLPTDLQALLTLRLLSESTSKRALEELALVIAPLEDLAGVASDLLAGRFDGEWAGAGDPSLLLLKAAIRAYRNAFNIRVEFGGVPILRASLAVLLRALAERGSSEAAALRAGLDQALGEALPAAREAG